MSSCVVCSKNTDNTITCFKCKNPFCTGCLKKRKQGRCPRCYKPSTGGSGGGGGGSFAFGSNDFDTALFGGSDGFGYLFPEALPDIPFRVIGSNSGFQGWMPKVKKIMGSIQQNFNPNDIDDVSDLDEEYQAIAREAECHGSATEPGVCPDCGLEIWFPTWEGGNFFEIPEVEEEAESKPSGVANNEAAAPAPAAAAKVVDPATVGKFSPGDKVKAKWRGGSVYSGTVGVDNKDGTYEIKFDDGDHDPACPYADIESVVVPKKVVDPATVGKFKTGDKVHAKWHNGSVYSGTVGVDNKDGTYEIKFDDGDHRPDCPFADITLK